MGVFEDPDDIRKVPWRRGLSWELAGRWSRILTEGRVRGILIREHQRQQLRQETAGHIWKTINSPFEWKTEGPEVRGQAEVPGKVRVTGSGQTKVFLRSAPRIFQNTELGS